VAGSDITLARRQTNGGIKYKLVEGFPKLSGDEDGTTATEEYLVPANQLGAFWAESLPVPVFFLNFILLPARRRMPGAPFLITKSLSCEPHSGQKPGDPFSFDPLAPNGTYDDLYRVTINYETMKESDDNERDENKPETFLEHSMSAGGEFLSIPPNKTSITDGDIDTVTSPSGGDEDNEDQQMPIVMSIPTIEHSFKWKFVLDPNWAEIYTQLGNINLKAIKFIPESKPETVMFTGVSGNQVYLWNGAALRVQPWSLTFKFSQRHIEEGGRTYGWNHVFSPKKGRWVYLFRAGDADGAHNPLYQRSDFLELFKRPFNANRLLPNNARP
jgi:hypothetical protein